jgi:hypothetical protein
VSRHGPTSFENRTPPIGGVLSKSAFAAALGGLFAGLLRLLARALAGLTLLARLLAGLLTLLARLVALPALLLLALVILIHINLQIGEISSECSSFKLPHRSIASCGQN